MPHKYEREIEEILRNIESSEPKRGLSDRIRSFQRPAPPRPSSADPRMRFPAPSPGATSLETLMLIGIALALLAAAVAFYLNGPTLLTGILAAAGFLLFALTIGRGWMEQFQGPRAPRVWRGESTEPTPIGARRRGIFGEVATQLRILRLKWRYRRSSER